MIKLRNNIHFHTLNLKLFIKKFFITTLYQAPSIVIIYFKIIETKLVYYNELKSGRNLLRTQNKQKNYNESKIEIK